jgi:hypothetical protein
MIEQHISDPESTRGSSAAIITVPGPGRTRPAGDSAGSGGALTPGVAVPPVTGLLEDFARRGYAHEATRYILRGQLILAFRKPTR